MELILAIDGMGGDDAPDAIVKGIHHFLYSYPSIDIKFLVFGDEDQLSKAFQIHGGQPDQCSLIHTEDVITSHTTATAAVRMINTSSMGKAIKAVASGQAQGVLSAGNTGAYMALSKLILKTIPEVDRPAIPAVIPSISGQTLVLDLGANVQCSAAQLVQFARLGQVYAQLLLQKPTPTIGLLNIGTEEIKGHAELQLAYQMLKNESTMNFLGFVEGDRIMAGTVDVVVTDGFTGNVVLKSIEGTARFITTMLKEEIQKTWRSKLGAVVCQPVFSALKHRLNPHIYNGAVFLGLKHIAVKSHGATDFVGFCSAIKRAVDMIGCDLSHQVQKVLCLDSIDA
jgi:glycerol-3-phosphate acyltransferase PlsX